MPAKSTTSAWLFPPQTREVQFDEKGSFVAKKEKHCDRADAADDRAGDCWAVRTLREEVAPKRYRQRTPAMAAGLADHVWSLEEGLRFPSNNRYKLPIYCPD